MDSEALLNARDYPIDDPSSAGYQRVVDRVRGELEDRGCSVLHGFFRSEAIAAMRDEARALEPLANANDIWTNAYSTRDDPSLPADHPVRLFMERSNAFVPKESIPRDTHLARVYHAAQFQQFVADCVQVPRIYEYADPFAGLVLNVLRPGAQHPWHYDTNEFIASALLQPPSGGGAFEYCPGIRGPGDENYDSVSRVIRGRDRAPVRRLDLAVGDLQLFRGRFSLHRVTRVSGAVERISAIFAYAERPGVIGRLERTRQLFGRVSAEHIAAEAATARADGLLD